MDDDWWVQHIFGESLAAKHNPETAKLAGDLPPRDALGFVSRLFSNIGPLLAPFTDQQVAEGLLFLGSTGESEWMYYLYDESIDRKARYDCIRSIESLYRDCFATRCRQTQTMVSERDPLNIVCFMWWDRFPGTSVELDGELIEVMTRALQIEHVACQESALHGLGHWERHNEDRVQAIIDDWLAKHPQSPPALRAYAEAARSGNVQ
jgi:hypothetical protein